MTGTLTFYDAAYPPASPPRTDGVLIYIGGDALHVWTTAEIAAQKARYRLPVWVRDNPAAVSPALDAAVCVRALRAIAAPAGTLVALDSEMTADPAWVHAFVGAVNTAGYRVIDYGTQSTVFGNANPDGYYFGADWTGVPHIAARDQITQWVSFAGYDEDLAQSSLPFWDTQPAAAPVIASWVAAGEGALAGMCAGIFRNAVSTVLRLTAEHSAHGLYTAAMSTYLDGVFAQDRAEVPADTVVWHPDGGTVTSFTSRGDQTLQGLANAWKCGPSAIVRCTAENSPGQVFGAAMSSYLDSVFLTSTAKVPAGVTLYYQKG
jgi:hypothetical protein